MDTIKYFDDLCGSSYTIIADSHGHSVDFNVYEGQGESLDTFITGWVKSDGCSNWKFTSPNYHIHFCSIDEARDFGTLFTRMYTWAAELMPEREEEILWELDNGKIKNDK